MNVISSYFPTKITPGMAFQVCNSNELKVISGRRCFMWKILGGSHWKIVILVSFRAIKIENFFKCQISFRYVAILVKSLDKIGYLIIMMVAN